MRFITKFYSTSQKLLQSHIRGVRFSALIVGICFLFLAFVRPLDYGIPEASPIDPYADGAFVLTQTPNASWEVVDAFPNLTFIDPIEMFQMEGTNDLWVLGKTGFIWSFDNNENVTEKQVVMDISERVDAREDAGLVGLALHPEFHDPNSDSKGYLYVLYRHQPFTNVPYDGTQAYIRVSRFEYDEETNKVDESSEFIMIEIFDRHDWHDGGGMFFGKDDFLYISIGDEGGSFDGFESTQMIDQSLFSGVLRIDVDMDPTRSHPIRRQPQEAKQVPFKNWPTSSTKGYYIPNDNPWVSEDGSTLEEFWAIGLRSPYRMTYDPVDDLIFVGDIGQNKREEVNVVQKGDNLQWPFREGFLEVDYAPKPVDLIGNEQGPLWQYPRSEGTCVIGGFVYRGDKWPSLKGKYVFGDHVNRKVWSMTYGAGIETSVETLTTVPASGDDDKSGLSGFATDEDGELYVLKLFGTNKDGGKIFKLKKDEDWSITPPQTLSATGIFPNFETMIPKAGFIPYGVNISFWSDRAQKSRWIAIPNNGSFNTAAEKIVNGGDDNWVYPEGTIFIKHFDLAMDERTPDETIKLETRFMVVGPDQTVKGFTYKWNQAQTDAILLTEGQNQDFSIIDEDGTTYNQRWNYPSRGACLSCHSPAAGYVLGFNTPQLNKDIFYPSSGLEDNQLRALNFLGAFSNPLNEAQIDNMNKWHPLTDASIDTADRLSMYLNVNCSYCHRPNGQFAGLDLRFNRPLESLVDLETKSNSSPEGSVVIMAGHPDSSQMWLRTNATTDALMPPLGRKLVDEDFVDMLGAWIEGLDNTNGGGINDPGETGDLIGYWPFDGGNKSDLAGDYQDEISFTGKLKRSAEGRLDKAFIVEGEDASFTISGSTEAPFKNTSQDYSISFWLKVIPKDARGRNGSSTTTLPSTNTNNQQSNSSSNTYSRNDGENTEEWRHVVVRSVSNTLDFYEDGNNADTPEDWGLQINQGQNSLYFSPSGNHAGFYIDEMRLFNYRIGTQKILELADGIGDPVVACNTGTLSQEFWYNLNTTTGLASIPMDEAPDEIKEITAFVSGQNIGDAYGSRISGYLCPPETGEYTFWIASNDNGQLSLSTDDNPDNKQVIATVSSFTKPEEWYKFPEQQSEPIYLEEGKRYYIEAVMKEGLGSDHLSVGWKRPSGTEELPMSAEYMSPYLPTSEAVKDLPGLDMLTPVDVSQWNVYPNPTDGNLTVSMLTDLQENGSLSLMNLQGQELMSRTVNESTTLDLSTLSPGIYLLVLEKGGSRQVQKIFRQ